jgi:small subunit ribosomal protein S6
MGHRYEVALILRTDGSEEQIQRYVARAEEVITKDGGSILHTDARGRRRLAYPISKQREGIYHFLTVDADPLLVEQWRRSFRLDDAILRVLILRAETPQPAQPGGQHGESESRLAHRQSDA